MLNRERHRSYIEEIRKIGARIKLISDGDIAGAIATSMPESGVDIAYGIGGSPEGILAAAALRTLGGEIQMKLWPRDEQEKIKVKDWDLNKVYFTKDLVGGEHVIFSATGVTDGDFLKGVKFIKGKAITDTIAMRTSSATIRRIVTQHDLNKKTIRLKSIDGDENIFQVDLKHPKNSNALLKNKFI